MTFLTKRQPLKGSRKKIKQQKIFMYPTEKKNKINVKYCKGNIFLELLNIKIIIMFFWGLKGMKIQI